MVIADIPLEGFSSFLKYFLKYQIVEFQETDSGVVQSKSIKRL